MIIENTDEETRHPWPEDLFIQGGGQGVVITNRGNYRTAFVEVFPRDPITFIRGEGSTIAEAEDDCWKKYQVYANCDGSGAPHGPFERRQYTNGSGFCMRCGTWFSKIFRPLPDNPDAPKSLLYKVFVDQDPEAIAEVLEANLRVDELPEKHECRASISGNCLNETEGYIGCTTEDGECVHAPEADS